MIFSISPRVLIGGVVMLAAANVSHAQCGAINTGGGNCTPPTAPGMPGDPAQQSYATPGNSAAKVDSWGAIVLDTKASSKGVATGQLSKTAAVRIAMDQCEANGASDCKLLIAYYNQCAAVAWGKDSYAYARNASEGDAKSVAKSECDKETSACKVVYSACSYARDAQ